MHVLVGNKRSSKTPTLAELIPYYRIALQYGTHTHTHTMCCARVRKLQPYIDKGTSSCSRTHSHARASSHQHGYNVNGPFSLWLAAFRAACNSVAIDSVNADRYTRVEPVWQWISQRMTERKKERTKEMFDVRMEMSATQMHGNCVMLDNEIRYYTHMNGIGPNSRKRYNRNAYHSGIYIPVASAHAHEIRRIITFYDVFCFVFVQHTILIFSPRRARIRLICIHTVAKV